MFPKVPTEDGNVVFLSVVTVQTKMLSASSPQVLKICLKI